MTHTQLDLFDYAPTREALTATPVHRLVPADMSDADLIAALPDAGFSEAPALAAEAGGRRLSGAVIALVSLCKRFHGFGIDRIVPEQAAALEALADIGGREASASVRQMVVDRIIQGPTLGAAASAASRLGVRFPADIALSLLRNPNPEIRAPACACVPARPEIAAMLIELLVDRVEEVAISAACALGRMGRAEARDRLKRYLNERPSPRLIEALAAIANEDEFVLLARVGRDRPDLTDAVISALEDVDHPRAIAVLSRLKRPPASFGRR